MQTDIPAGAKIETPTEVMTRLRRKKTWLWSRIRTDPSFPRPIYISPREPVFFQHEIDGWLSAQAAKRGVQGVEHATA